MFGNGKLDKRSINPEIFVVLSKGIFVVYLFSSLFGGLGRCVVFGCFFPQNFA
jgi:hypothetical protein